MAYATYQDVEDRMSDTFGADRKRICGALLEDAAVLIDAYNKNASAEAKKVVSCRMVVRCMGSGDADIPIGATQGSMSALGYSQSWTMSGGSTGEVYISKQDKKILGAGERLGSHSPIEDL